MRDHNDVLQQKETVCIPVCAFSPLPPGYDKIWLYTTVYISILCLGDDETRTVRNAWFTRWTTAAGKLSEIPGM